LRERFKKNLENKSELAVFFISKFILSLNNVCVQVLNRIKVKKLKLKNSQLVLHNEARKSKKMNDDPNIL